MIETPTSILRSIAKKSKEKRLSLNLTQHTVAERSGVSYGTLKKFEQTGQISFFSLLKIANALGCLEDFNTLFLISHTEPLPSLDSLLKSKKRQRGKT